MNSKNNNWRYEKKFLIKKEEKGFLEFIIKNNKFLFKENFEKRKVRSIYFDDLDLNSYNENISGLSNRTKYRLRWYGETFEETLNAQFELKIKRNKMNIKKIFKLNKIHFDVNENKKSILEKTLKSIHNKELKSIIKNLKPVAFVEYERSYFESYCRNIRITFDTDILFRRASNPKIKNSFLNYEILEIKYNSDKEDEFLKFIPFLQRRYDRNSKYINAIKTLSVI